VPDAEERKMFGCPAYFINGYMFAGAHQDDIILRLSKSDQDEILSIEGAAPFMPMPGRIMKDYVMVPPSIYKSESEFQKWLKRSSNYTMSLPPKIKKPKKSIKAPSP
jgi:TfoX/Sxy family transcriptional regulator of competence genes